MTVGLLIITDGRGEYLEQMWRSFKIEGPAPSTITVVDDSGDDDYAKFVWDLIRPNQLIHHQTRRGLAGAIESGWEAMKRANVDYVLHLEDDFTFPEPIPLGDMIRLLTDTALAQIALKRQPALTPIEQAVGGFMELHPDAYWDHPEGPLVIHDRLFTFNPCVYPAEVMNVGAGLENEVTDKLRSDGWGFAYYGLKADPPRCIHIGRDRSAGWKP